jgi:hypothetical protein
MNEDLRRAILDGSQPSTNAGRELLRYMGGDLDRDVIRRGILKIEYEARSSREGVTNGAADGMRDAEKS